MTWGNSINTQKQTQALETLDRLATKARTAITKTTQQASIELIIDLIPIELMIQETGISAYLRLKEQLPSPLKLNTKQKLHFNLAAG